MSKSRAFCYSLLLLPSSLRFSSLLISISSLPSSLLSSLPYFLLFTLFFSRYLVEIVAVVAALQNPESRYSIASEHQRNDPNSRNEHSILDEETHTPRKVTNTLDLLFLFLFLFIFASLLLRKFGSYICSRLRRSRKRSKQIDKRNENQFRKRFGSDAKQNRWRTCT